MLRRLLLRLTLIVLVAFPRTVLAQSRDQSPEPSAGQFSLQGKVLDPAGGAVVGARVSAIRDRALSGRSVVSDQRGEFTLLLDAGRYAISVAADGFATTTETMSVPQTGSQSRAFTLQVAGVKEAVTVTANGGYQLPATTSGTKTLTPLRDVPQSITVVTQQLMKDQAMTSMGDVVRYVPGIGTHAGDNNRDTVVIRGNTSSADFFVNGVRDDVEYYRDLYNLERVEALKGPNAMIFGRGGGGGVINRVTKEASFMPLREVTVLGGSYGAKRFAIDVDQRLREDVAFRVNGMYENSDSFRQYVNLERYGLNPTLTITPSTHTKITLNYEHFRDGRVADRGIPSFQGQPADLARSTYFGNPNDSRINARVDLGGAMVEHQVGSVNIRNRTIVGDYDKFYQNFVPGAVTADKSQVSLSAYNNATKRLNVFNQTDVTYAVLAGHIRHTLLAGIEIGRQLTDNFRNTGYFNNATTSMSVAYASAVTSTPVTFRQSATDADNHLQTSVAAAYLQDQVELSRHVQAIAGLRVDRFDLRYHNNRTGDDLRRVDDLVSPRAGLVVKPITPLSLYGTYSVSYLPSSGDQFSSLTTITQQVKPEKFNNYELGAKWDLDDRVSLTTAVYRLDRTNTRATDPNDPTRIVQTGSQRTNGFEFGVNGRLRPDWNVAGGYAFQDAQITSATTAARAGALVAQVPRHTFSLWNNYQFLPRVGAGLGILYRSDMYAAVDNTVILPGYTRADAAAFFSLTERVRLQANVENVFDTRYFINAQSNTNISPGSPRTVRVGLTARF